MEFTLLNVGGGGWLAGQYKRRRACRYKIFLNVGGGGGGGGGGVGFLTLGGFKRDFAPKV